MQIEFALTTALEVSHYAPIARALMESGATVNFAVSDTKAIGWDSSDDIKRALGDLPYAQWQDRNADVAITIQSAEFLRHYHGLKMRFMYGVGLVAPEHKQPIDRRYSFDYYLVPGPFSARVQFTEHSLPSELLPPERVKVIGYPRFDAWWASGGSVGIDAHFGGMSAREERSAKPAEGSGQRPILLWLPTWGAASSILRFIDAIAALSNRYDIWVKPHHGTASCEPLRMNMLANAPMRVIDFTEPPERSFAAASVVLADLASGAFTESLFLGKPTLALSDWKPKRLIRCAHLIPTCLEPESLEHDVETAESMRYGTDQRALVDELFDSTRGHDGERAARAIMECAS